MPSRSQRKSEIRITFKDIEQAQYPDISITTKDIDALDSNILRVTLEDLVRFDAAVLHIKLEDLPPDMTNAITDCYHGTSKEAAERIRREGFRVGPGNAIGSGIYFAVGNVGCAPSFTKSNGIIIRARVSWGRVAYLDDSNIPSGIRGSGDAVVTVAKKHGIDSIIQSSKYSRSNPTIGVILAKYGSYVKPPQIEVVELIDP